MSLNIKNKEAHALARRLAELTGKSMAEAVTDAIRKEVEEAERSSVVEKRKENLLRIARECAALMSESTKNLSVDDLLYDPVTGLPRDDR